MGKDEQPRCDDSHVDRLVSFDIGKWYKTSDGFSVEFLTPIEKDGMHNVFRHNEGNDYKPYYTDEFGRTAYGERITTEEN